MVQAWGRPPIETYTIVGVASDTDSGRLMSRGNDTTYVPLAQHYERFFVILATHGAQRFFQDEPFRDMAYQHPDRAEAAASSSAHLCSAS